MAFVPLSLKAKLRSPAVLGHPYLHGDGVLAHLHQRDFCGQAFWSLPSRRAVEPTGHAKKRGLKLLKLKDWEGEYWNCDYFQAASAWVPKRVQTVTIYKRFDADDIDLWDAVGKSGKPLSKRVDNQRGPFKDWVIDLVLARDAQAEFFFLGEEEWVRDLCENHLTHLGKKACIGWGEIASLEIKRFDDPKLILLDENGCARRPLPWWALADFAQSDLRMGTIRAPYWDKRGIKPILPPGKPATLHREIVRQLEVACG